MTNTWGGATPDAPRKALFRTRRPTWQWMMWFVAGLVIVLVGLVSAVRDATSGRPDAMTMAGLSVFFFCGTGALAVLLAAAIRRSGIEGFDDHLAVRFGFRKPRIVRPTDIRALQSEVQSRNGMTWSSIVGRGDRKKRLFQAFIGYPGTDELAGWLAARCPKEWSAYLAAVGGRRS
ncbi:hypothetical protein [Curtobacterium aetherium]|uniref:Uncharacterized protein n=1 Tax=Curtobacterium aetherium TaxID=2841594 RepID=A0ACD1E169_9MICO|nr:hypothetical protein [Curtobacterium sp. L6-1]QWS32312.1 hypothetical protein KM842_08250 [Curtobacterium sp. L6-1]